MTLTLAAEAQRHGDMVCRSTSGRGRMEGGCVSKADSLRSQRAMRSRNASGAIPDVDFRPRVSCVTKYHERFEPCDGCRNESAPSQRRSVRVRAEVAFPAAASATDLHTTTVRCSSLEQVNRVGLTSRPSREALRPGLAAALAEADAGLRASTQMTPGNGHRCASLGARHTRGSIALWMQRAMCAASLRVSVPPWPVGRTL